MDQDSNAAGSGAYVLHALGETERDDFEAQLADSGELRNEVTELTDTAVLLGLAVEPVTPSVALKQNIMARLGQTPQFVREEPPLPARRSAPTLANTNGRWFRRPAIALTAAAAAVVLIAGAVVGTYVATQGAANNARADTLTAITTASDARHVQRAVSSGGTVTLVWSLRLKKSALIGKGLRVLPSGKTYELWYIHGDGTATPAGLFESTGKQSYALLTGHMVKGDTVGVTIEPSGGSKVPTTKPVAAISST